MLSRVKGRIRDPVRTASGPMEPVGQGRCTGHRLRDEIPQMLQRRWRAIHLGAESHVQAPLLRETGNDLKMPVGHIQRYRILRVSLISGFAFTHRR